MCKQTTCLIIETGRLQNHCILNGLQCGMPFHSTVLLSRLYTFHILHFTGISRMFSRNTPGNTKHLLYTFRISCEFRVLLMPQKNKPQNPLTFCVNADPGVKCCKMWKAKKVTRNTPLYSFYFVFTYFKDGDISMSYRYFNIFKFRMQYDILFYISIYFRYFTLVISYHMLPFSFTTFPFNGSWPKLEKCIYFFLT